MFINKTNFLKFYVQMVVEIPDFVGFLFSYFQFFQSFQFSIRMSVNFYNLVSTVLKYIIFEIYNLESMIHLGVFLKVFIFIFRKLTVYSKEYIIKTTMIDLIDILPKWNFIAKCQQQDVEVQKQKMLSWLNKQAITIVKTLKLIMLLSFMYMITLSLMIICGKMTKIIQ